MYILNTNLDEYERKVLKIHTNNDYYILTEIQGECYVLSANGILTYNDCFKYTDDEYFKNQKYERVVSYRMIKVYHYYLMQILNEPNIWYRGRKDENQNYEFDCCCDSLEEMLESL